MAKLSNTPHLDHRFLNTLYSNGKRVIVADTSLSFVTGDFNITSCSVSPNYDGRWNGTTGGGCFISLTIYIPNPAYSKSMLSEGLREEVKKLVGGIASASNEELMLQIHKNMENRNA